MLFKKRDKMRNAQVEDERKEPSKSALPLLKTEPFEYEGRSYIEIRIGEIAKLLDAAGVSGEARVAIEWCLTEIDTDTKTLAQAVKSLEKSLKIAQGEIEWEKEKASILSSDIAEIKAELNKQKLELDQIKKARDEYVTRCIGTTGTIRASGTPIRELDLSVRAYNGLKRHGISTVEELTGCTRSELLNIHNFGEKSVNEIWGKLIDLGLNLK